MCFEIESSNDILTTHSGLGLVGLLYENTDLTRKLNEASLPGLNRIPTMLNADIVRAYLVCLRKVKMTLIILNRFVMIAFSNTPYN